MPETLDSFIFHEFDIPLTISEIENAISEFKVYKSPGFKNIFSEFFKKCSTFFHPFLEKLFDVILNKFVFHPFGQRVSLYQSIKKGV